MGSVQEVGVSKIREAERLDRLQAELEGVVAKDSRYWLQNDAKFRAVAQGASYEQFEELVATSHLTPVGKEDIVGGEAERKSLWNPVAVAQQAKQVVGSEVVKNLATAGEQEKEPTTVKEFRDAWANGSENDQLVLLNKLGDDSLQRLFSTDIPVDIFKKIVSLFLKLNGNEELVKNTLLTLSRSSRFSLCLLFMESQDKADVEVLIDRLEKKGLEGIDQLKQIYH